MSRDLSFWKTKRTTANCRNKIDMIAPFKMIL